MSEWARRFEDLEVFRRAYRLSLEVHRASLEFPRIEQFALADQIRRASKSICANIAEGFGKQRQSRTEFHRFVRDGDRLGRRDAGMDPLRSRSRLYRGRNSRALAERILGDCPNAAGPLPPQL